MMKNKIYIVPLLWSMTLLLAACNQQSSDPLLGDDDDNTEEQKLTAYVTYPDRTFLLGKVTPPVFKSSSEAAKEILVDSTQTYQTMDGFGFALTGGSAMHLYRMDAAKRQELLNELFKSDQKNIGVSYLRVSVGASDLDSAVFSYDDIPAGQTDPELKNFSIDKDRLFLLPVLKQILEINPDIKIMASPWSAPTWMKTNGKAKGGSLKPEYYGAFAKYLAKYIQAMTAEGVTIDALTIQNEPENANNTPSMLMTAAEQNIFVRDHLGPLFEQQNIKTKIVLFDHNCDNPGYPIAILNDQATRKYVDGSAFHMYLGEITAMSTVRNAHPDKNLYFTEQWTSGEGNFGGDLRWHVSTLIVGGTRNWGKVVLEWNLASNSQFEPHTGDGGCNLCMGALTIDGNTVTRNVSYYIIGHASRFVKPGAVRIGSNLLGGLPNVAFMNPDGSKVLIVVNDSNQENSFAIKYQEKYATTSLPAGAVATYLWD